MNQKCLVYKFESTLQTVSRGEDLYIDASLQERHYTTMPIKHLGNTVKSTTSGAVAKRAKPLTFCLNSKRSNKTQSGTQSIQTALLVLTFYLMLHVEMVYRP
jgi:hypothetical protein